MEPTKKNAMRAVATALLLIAITVAVTPLIRATEPRPAGAVTFVDSAVTGDAAVQAAFDAAYRSIAADETSGRAPSELWTTGFVERQPDGGQTDKMEAEAAFEDKSDRFGGLRGAITLDSLAVYGDKAIAAYRRHVEPSVATRRHIADDQNCKDTWTKVGGRWLISATTVLSDQFTVNGQAPRWHSDN